MDDLRKREIEANIAKLEAEKQKLEAEASSITYRDGLETIKLIIITVGIATTAVATIIKLTGS